MVVLVAKYADNQQEKCSSCYQEGRWQIEPLTIPSRFGHQVGCGGCKDIIDQRRVAAVAVVMVDLYFVFSSLSSVFLPLSHLLPFFSPLPVLGEILGNTIQQYSSHNAVVYFLRIFYQLCLCVAVLNTTAFDTSSHVCTCSFKQMKIPPHLGSFEFSHSQPSHGGRYNVQYATHPPPTMTVPKCKHLGGMH